LDQFIWLDQYHEPNELPIEENPAWYWRSDLRNAGGRYPRARLVSVERRPTTCSSTRYAIAPHPEFDPTGKTPLENVPAPFSSNRRR
jgi:hypothetical protein